MAVSRFPFGGGQIIAPGVLVQTLIGANQAQAVLPFGIECFVGESDGGHGNGTVYFFVNPLDAQAVLRGGATLDAINQATNIGGSTGIIVAVIGTKTSASATISGLTGASAVLAAGDQGDWTNQIQFEIQNGTTGGTKAFTVFWPDSNGQINSQGGLGTAFDNLEGLADLKAAIEANVVLTPPSPSQQPSIITLTIATNGVPSNFALTNLAGGTGNGSYGGATYVAPSFSAVKAGIDALEDVQFDLGCLVKIYDGASQAYAVAQAQVLQPYAYLRSWIFQTQVNGVSPTNSKQTNSAAVVAAGVAAAAALNNKRASMLAQQLRMLNPQTGALAFFDAAPVYMGLAAFVGATGSWGPASPLTFELMPLAADVDYAVLRGTGDQDKAVEGGLVVFQKVGAGLRVVQSVTTEPFDVNGNPWDFSEFSIVRVSDALLLSMKNAVESNSPKGIGAGNSLGTLHGLLADARTVLQNAQDAQWITTYDPNSIQIAPSGSSGSDFLLDYSAAPTRPINHIGITQTLIPFQATINVSPNG